MLVTLREDIQVWCERDRPVRLVWRGERWRIIDRPTRSTSSSSLWDGWRFTMRSDTDHRTMVADVERVDSRWALVAAYA